MIRCIIPQSTQLAVKREERRPRFHAQTLSHLVMFEREPSNGMVVRQNTGIQFIQ